MQPCYSIHREQLRFDGLAVGLKRRLHRVLFRVIRATPLVSASLDSLLLAILAMGGPPYGVLLAHVLGELLGRDALHSIDFLEDGGLILATRHRVGLRSVGAAVDVLSVVTSTQAPTRLGGHQT